MKVHETEIPGVLIIDTDVFGDHRGYFTETYNKPKYEAAGIHADFVQDNMSFQLSLERSGVCIGKILHMLRQNLSAVQKAG